MYKFAREKPVIFEIYGTGRRNGTHHCGCHIIPCFYQGV